ncbi:MAG: ABC transporter permease [Armatimonadota bacterium]
MVVSRLNIKLLRDIRFSPYMFVGVVFLLLVGIILFVASYELFLNLQNSYALSYRTLSLADFTVPVQSAPSEIISTLRRIPGVSGVDGRMVQEVEIEQPESESRKVVGRIISLPDSDTPDINQLKVINGAYPQINASREILLEASFAKYHNYTPGDILSIVVQDDDIRFRITGIVQSPEYIYVVRGREYPMPTPRTFGVMWMRKSMVDELFGTSGAVNDISFTMVPGGNRSTAMRLAEQILRPYGAEEAIPQEDQPSVELLRQDLLGLQRLALLFPLLFLIISSLSVYNMLSRMVHAQRSQIGFLRAVGFTKRVVVVHYVLYALIVGGFGGLIGSVAGHYFGISITYLYTTFIQVPYFDVAPRWAIMIGGLVMALAVTFFSGLSPALSTSRLTPAEAISAEISSVGRTPVIENFLPFLRRFSLLSRLPLRNFFRNSRRTISTVAGVASGATLLLVSSGLHDSTIAAINFYFEKSIHYDILASYLHPQSQFALEQIERWPGVKHVEPVLAVPAKLVKDDKDQIILVYGIEPGSRLISLTNSRGDLVPIQPNGLMIAESTARSLETWNGGRIRLTLPQQVIPEVPEPTANQGTLPTGRIAQALQQPRFRDAVFTYSRGLLDINLDKLVSISGVTYQPVGSTAYASIDQVRRWYGSALELPPNAINSVAIEADPRYVPTIERRLYDLEGIASVEVTKYIVEEIDELLRQSRTFFNVMLAFSIALAGVIIFNSTLMNVIERTREIATLRTVGLSIGAAARMVWVENLMAYVVGIIIGIPFGTWLSGRFVQAYETESFSMQTVIFTHTYMITVFGILLTVALAQIPGIRYIRSIELPKATKDVG